LVITDVLTPVMDGYEFVRRMRLDPINSGIPAVFYTAHFVEHQAKAFALSSGISYVLTKPADSADVLNVVGRLLSSDAASEGLRAGLGPVAAQGMRRRARAVCRDVRDTRHPRPARQSRARRSISC
jgi:DNA-binding response OmpR family regulator